MPPNVEQAKRAFESAKANLRQMQETAAFIEKAHTAAGILNGGMQKVFLAVPTPHVRMLLQGGSKVAFATAKALNLNTETMREFRENYDAAVSDVAKTAGQYERAIRESEKDAEQAKEKIEEVHQETEEALEESKKAQDFWSKAAEELKKFIEGWTQQSKDPSKVSAQSVRAFQARKAGLEKQVQTYQARHQQLDQRARQMQQMREELRRREMLARQRMEQHLRHRIAAVPRNLVAWREHTGQRLLALQQQEQLAWNQLVNSFRALYGPQPLPFRRVLVNGPQQLRPLIEQHSNALARGILQLYQAPGRRPPPGQRRGGGAFTMSASLPAPARTAGVAKETGRTAAKAETGRATRVKAGRATAETKPTRTSKKRSTRARTAARGKSS